MNSFRVALCGCFLIWPPVVYATTNSNITSITVLEQNLAKVQTPAGLSQFYAKDCVLYEGMVPGVYRGAQQIIAAYAAQMTDIKSIKVTFRELHVEADGTLGTAYSIQHAVVLTSSGTVRTATWRQTDILRKDGDGRWWIVHEHVSYPADPKTGMTDFDQ